MDAVTSSDTIAHLTHLAAQASPESPESVDELRDALVQTRAYEQLGDLQQHAQDALLDKISQGNVLLAESIKLRLADLRSELMPLDPTPAAKLLVERAVALSAQLAHSEHMMAMAKPASKEAEFWFKLQRQFNGQYVDTLKALQSCSTSAAGKPAEPSTSKTSRLKIAKCS